MNNNSWEKEFVKCLELGTTNPSLANNFNDIVILMRDSDNSLIEALVQKYSIEWLALRYEEFLDRLFVSDNPVVSVFPSSLPQDAAKKRYRQLIRVFHPDRGTHEELWLNYRAERVNKAYEEYDEISTSLMADLHAPKAESVPPSVNVSKKTASTKKVKLSSKIKYKPNKLREQLGSAKEVQTRIILGLIVFSVALILLVFASSNDSSDPEGENSLITLSEASFPEDGTDDQLQNKTLLELIVDDKNSESSGSFTGSAQKLIDEANWLNESLDDASIVRELDVSELGEEETVNFSDFSTQRRLIDLPAEVEDVDEIEPSNQYAESDGLVVYSSQYCNKLSVAALDVANSSNDTFVTFAAYLNVRSGPSKNCPSEASLKGGQPVRKLKKIEIDDKTWVNITWRGASNQIYTGWASERFLRLSKDKSRAQAKARMTSVAVSPTSRKSNSHEKNINAKLPTSDGRDSEGQFEKSDRPGEGKYRRNNVEVSGASLAKVELNELISQLREAFELGDAEALASLYTSSGRENRTKGVTKIARQYARLFKKTADRQVTYNISSYELDGSKGPVLSGTMISAYKRSDSGGQVRSVAKIRLVITKVRNNYRIVSFDWSAI